MPAERLSMRQIREVLRLCFESRLPQRAAARSLGLSQGAVSGYLSRARAAGIAWPLADDLDDAGLEALLFPPQPSLSRTRPLPNWALVHRELGRRGVTLDLLWNEYKAQEPEGDAAAPGNQGSDRCSGDHRRPQVVAGEDDRAEEERCRRCDRNPGRNPRCACVRPSEDERDKTHEGCSAKSHLEVEEHRLLDRSRHARRRHHGRARRAVRH